MNRYTATAIAEIVCEAEDQPLDVAMLNRIRHLARGDDLLLDARTIDGRGTKDFPALEVYRARLFVTLFDFTMDARGLRDVSAAGSLMPLTGGASRGGLRDAISGIANGEKWSLVIASFPPLVVDLPDFYAGSMLYVRFAKDGTTESDPLRTIDGAKPYGLLRLDLNLLFEPIIALIGVPS